MLTKKGIDVTYVICTDGSKGSSDPDMTSAKLIELRKEEQLDAAKVLGLKDVVFLNYPDSYLEPSLKLRHDIAQEIRSYKPNIVITTYPSRNLSTHHGIGGRRQLWHCRKQNFQFTISSFIFALFSFEIHNLIVENTTYPVIADCHFSIFYHDRSNALATSVLF